VQSATQTEPGKHTPEGLNSRRQKERREYSREEQAAAG
jgi:hypothetical protein